MTTERDFRPWKQLAFLSEDEMGQSNDRKECEGDGRDKSEKAEAKS